MSSRTIALGSGAEFDLIRRFLGEQGRKPVPGVIVGPGDDCAVIEADQVALSIDLAIEGVHFQRDWLGAEEIGYRAAVAAFSDLAAAAARPIGVLASLGVTAADAEAIGPLVMRGVGAAAAEAGAAVLGGDLTRSPGPIVLDLAVAGAVATPALRSGALPGDSLWVSGRLGGAAAAVEAWRKGRAPSEAARAAFARPPLRIAEAQWLAERGLVRALIDLSDGLAGDAGHLAAASGANVRLDAASVPMHEALGEFTSDRALELALYGGEDYELLFAAAAGTVEVHRAAFERSFEVPLTRVGSVASGAGVTLRHTGGEDTPADTGFDHFRQATP